MPQPIYKNLTATQRINRHNVECSRMAVRRNFWNLGFGNLSFSWDSKLAQFLCCVFCRRNSEVTSVEKKAPLWKVVLVPIGLIVCLGYCEISVSGSGANNFPSSFKISNAPLFKGKKTPRQRWVRFQDVYSVALFSANTIHHSIFSWDAIGMNFWEGQHMNKDASLAIYIFIILRSNPLICSRVGPDLLQHNLNGLKSGPMTEH